MDGLWAINRPDLFTIPIRYGKKFNHWTLEQLKSTKAKSSQCIQLLLKLDIYVLNKPISSILHQVSLVKSKKFLPGTIAL